MCVRVCAGILFMTTLTGINLASSTGALVYTPSGGTNWSTLPVGSSAQLLISNGLAPVYVTLSGGLTVNSSGVATVTNNQVVSTKTANYSLVSSDCGTLFTDLGASSAVTLTLPAPTTGFNCSFNAAALITLNVVVKNSSTDTIYSNSSNTTIQGHTLMFPGGGTNAYGNLSLVAINTTSWVITSIIGTWSLS